MNDLPWFPFDVRDWMTSRARRRMSFAARGMYIDLLAEQWDAGDLPEDADELAKLLQCTRDEFDAIWPEVRGQFESVGVGLIANRRLAEVRIEQAERRQRLSAAGRKGGKKPKPKASVKPGLSQAKATLKASLKPPLSNTETETEADTETTVVPSIVENSGIVENSADGWWATVEEFIPKAWWQGQVPPIADDHQEWTLRHEYSVFMHLTGEFDPEALAGAITVAPKALAFQPGTAYTLRLFRSKAKGYPLVNRCIGAWRKKQAGRERVKGPVPLGAVLRGMA